MKNQWELEIGRGQRILNPDWQDIEDALTEMDGDISEVIVELVNEGKLSIEGGNQGRYLVVSLPDDHPDVPSLVLADLSLSDPHVALTVQTSTDLNDSSGRGAIHSALRERDCKDIASLVLAGRYELRPYHE